MYSDFNTRRTIISEAAKKHSEKKVFCKSNYLHRNRFCDDKLQLDLYVFEQKIIKINFCASGCTLILASSQILENILLNKNIFEARTIINKFKNMLENQQVDLDLGDLNAFVNVKNHLNRLVCVQLPIEALELEILDENKK